MKLVCLSAAFFACVPFFSVAHAQSSTGAAGNYPSRPIKLIIPFAPGGFTDVVGRVLSLKLGEAFGQSIVIENKPGAGSTIGTDMVAKSPADGYTLLMISTAYAIVPAMYKNLPYDPKKSFAPVAELVEAPYVLVTTSSLPVGSVKDLISYSQARPGQVNYASSGNGTIQHLSGAMFASMSESPIVHVPYRGSGQAATDLISGTVQLSFVGAPVAVQHASRLRALAVTSEKRSPQFPGLPTVAEAGVPNYSATSWAAILAPAGTPADIVAKLNGAISKALSSPEAIKTLNEAGVDVATGSPEALGQLIAIETEKWGKVVQETGAQMN